MATWSCPMASGLEAAAVMAPAAQVRTQAPQPMHRSTKWIELRLRMRMARVGHTLRQSAQPVQRSG